MNYENIFYKRAQLLINVLPYISEEKVFALKGGTAINYFVQDLPRYSVDIDLVYLPLLPRKEALLEMKLSLLRVERKIQSQLPEVKVTMDSSQQVTLPKLIVRRGKAEVIIEINPIFRGSVYPPEMRTLSAKVQEVFESFVVTAVASIADLYGGKFCATLSRQHPRDLFDVKYLLEHQGITNEMRQAFVVYLASDRRPIHELLLPNEKSEAAQRLTFNTEFQGMTAGEISCNELLGVVKQLSVKLRQQLTSDEKRFLLSLSAGEPEWDKLAHTHIQELPAIRWKLLNIKKMNPDKRKQTVFLLQQALENIG